MRMIALLNKLNRKGIGFFVENINPKSMDDQCSIINISNKFDGIVPKLEVWAHWPFH